MTLRNVFSAIHRGLYRLLGGRAVGSFAGAPVLLLTTTGRRSGKKRTMPLLYLRDGDAIAVVASAGGQEAHPAWFLNLRANPEVEVEIGRERRTMRAREASPEERERLWPRLVEMYKSYGDYQLKTSRKIPVVLLERHE